MILRVINKNLPRYLSDRLFEEFKVLDFKPTLCKGHFNQNPPDEQFFLNIEYHYHRRNKHQTLLNLAKKALLQHHFNYLAVKLFNMFLRNVTEFHHIKFNKEMHK